MTMRIEYDREAKALYLYVAEGEHVRAVEVEPLKIYPDVDAEGRILGIEFLSWDAFPQYIEEHGGLNQPERFGDSNPWSHPKPSLAPTTRDPRFRAGRGSRASVRGPGQLPS